ncbi:MAG: acyloxyacyl hydrolase [Flavobacteriia bacterium]|nr:acyloxyacyl hydrolase [Flavobacteriia bacterium]OJX39222.1 MAG: hypothetical protein BGO87_04355 [Flavobacteriia bacterium 40-80]
MKNLFYLLITFLIALSAFAQGNNHLGIEIQNRTGFIIAHRGLMSHIPESHAIGGELTVYYQTKGKSEYHQLYKYPKYGVSFIGTSVGNGHILGSMFGGIVFGDFPFIKTKKDEFSGNIGVGIGYVTKIYDPVKNPKNSAISTHLNALINLGIKYRHYFSNGLYFNLGFNITHASNGASRVPNLGVNLIQPSIGIGYLLENVELKTKEQKIELDKKWKFGLLGIVSCKEIYPIGGKLHLIGNLSFTVTKRFTKKSGIEIYADGFYKTSILNDVYRDDTTPWNVIQAGVFSAYNLYINKLRVVVGLGAYVYDKFKPDGPIYTRLGFKYQINNHLLAVVGLKSHWAKADYVEYGIGYTF